MTLARSLSLKWDERNLTEELNCKWEWEMRNIDSEAYKSLENLDSEK